MEAYYSSCTWLLGNGDEDVDRSVEVSGRWRGMVEEGMLGWQTLVGN